MILGLLSERHSPFLGGIGSRQVNDFMQCLIRRIGGFCFGYLSELAEPNPLLGPKPSSSPLRCSASVYLFATLAAENVYSVPFVIVSEQGIPALEPRKHVSRSRPKLTS